MSHKAESESVGSMFKKKKPSEFSLGSLFRRRPTEVNVGALTYVDREGASAPSTPVPNGGFTGHFDGYDGKFFSGWAISTASDTPVEICILYNDIEIRTVCADKFRQDLFDKGIGNGSTAFTIEIDIRELLELGEGELRFVDKSSGTQLPNGCFRVRSPELKWSIELVRDEMIHGWVADVSNPSVELNLIVNIDDREHTISANLERQDLKALGINEHRHGFHLDISSLLRKDVSEVSVRVEHAGSHYLMDGQQVQSFQSKIEALTDLQRVLRDNSLLPERQQKLLSRSILPALIDDARLRKSLPLANVPSPSDRYIDEEVAVIVPVYAGVEETIGCLKSVLNSKNETKYRLVVIDDCGPDSEMLEEIEDLRNEFDFELLPNEVNLGFVKTVNRGMRYADTQDVILLNSDTIVADGWLDALKKDAYSSRSIGTVTPMSNNATICSFPAFCSDNELPDGYDAQSLSEICKNFGTPPIELPTAHGFCMFIKRELINEIGYFDEQKWGKGYAEENDFSMRALKLGWSNVMTNKTFVQHLGSVSFAEYSTAFIVENLQKLNGLYPDYPKMIRKFIDNDPVRILRKDLAKALLVKESLTYKYAPPAKGRSILFVSLTMGGGTKIASDDLAERLAGESQSVFMLTSTAKNNWAISSHESEVVAEFDMDIEHDEFYSFLRELDVWHVHYHQVLEFDQSVWDISKQLSCEYDVTIHDYYSICPRVNLISNGNVHCGKPDLKKCNNCLKVGGVHFSSHLNLSDLGGSIESWRQFFGEKLGAARMVIAPSKDAQSRLMEYLPIQNVKVKYHPESQVNVTISAEQKDPGQPINIGFIGAIGEHKGLQVIRDLALEIEQKSLDTKITILGYTPDDVFFERFDFVKITGKYDRDNLSELINENGVDLIFLASIWPETFSYTYSEVSRLGVFVLTYDLGAVPERSRGSGVKVIPVESTPSDIIRFASEIFKKDSKVTITTGEAYNSVVSDYYEMTDEY